MTRIFNPNEQCDIRVYLPGPPGPPLVSVGSFIAPTLVNAGTIAAPTNRFQRSFIQSSVAVLNQPTIPNPPDNGAWLWSIYNVGGFQITINDASNIKLSGQLVMNPDTILWLQWDGNSRWVEDHRNEI